MKITIALLLVAVLCGGTASAVEPQKSAPEVGRFQIVRDLVFPFFQDGKVTDGEHKWAILDTATGDIYSCQKSSQQPVSICILSFRMDVPRK